MKMLEGLVTGLLKPIFLLLILCMGAGACANIDYISNDKLQEISHLYPSINDEIFAKNKKYGALVIEKNDVKKNESEENTVFLLKQHKSKYFAETLFLSNVGKTKFTFEKAYFSLGTDYRGKTIGIGFRLTY